MRLIDAYKLLLDIMPEDDFCSYGQRKETDLDEAIEKYLKIKEGGQHGQAENLRGAWG